MIGLRNAHGCGIGPSLEGPRAFFFLAHLEARKPQAIVKVGLMMSRRQSQTEVFGLDETIFTTLP